MEEVGLLDIAEDYVELTLSRGTEKFAGLRHF
jgi:hypothetical protein